MDSKDAIPKVMKGIRIFGADDIRVVEEPVQEPGPEQLLVKIGSAGLCHSDLAIFPTIKAKEAGGEKWSIRPCHEACGTVVGLGSAAAGFNLGDPVGFLLYLDACSSCEACKINPVACPHAKLQGFAHDGFMSEYAVVQASQAIQLPPGMSTKQSASLFCAGLTAFHAVKKAGIQAGQWYAVVGVGGLGTFAVKFALKMGYKVLALDIGETQLTTAKNLGAHAVFDPRDANLVTQIRELTGGGAHAAAVFSGSTRAYQTAASILRIGGNLVCAGITDPEPLPIPTSAIALNLINIIGVSSGRSDEMSEVVDFTHAHGITCDAKEHKLEDYPALLEEMRAGKSAGRSIIVF